MRNSNTEDTQRHYWLYVLKLEHDKYYVGITSKTPEKRLQQHIDGVMGARWTKEYRPIEIFDKKDLGDMNFDSAQKYENKVARAYMKKYGFNNVRGGDLNYSGLYVKRFGWYFVKDGWEDITIVVFLLLVILFLLLDKYLF